MTKKILETGSDKKDIEVDLRVYTTPDTKTTCLYLNVNTSTKFLSVPHGPATPETLALPSSIPTGNRSQTPPTRTANFSIHYPIRVHYYPIGISIRAQPAWCDVLLPLNEAERDGYSGSCAHGYDFLTRLFTAVTLEVAGCFGGDWCLTAIRIM
jgi:hypothetical protein